jgi:tetratricopeptide (TPR) repeat protein
MMDWIKEAMAPFAAWDTSDQIAAVVGGFTVLIAFVSGLYELFAGKEKAPVLAPPPVPTAETKGEGTGIQQFGSGSSGNTAHQAGGDVIAPTQAFNNCTVILSQYVTSVSQEKSVPLPVLQAVLASMGEEAQEFGPEKVEGLLRQKADEYNQLKAQLARFEGSDAGIQQLRKDAAAAMDKGQFDAVRAILLEIRRRDREALAAQQAATRQRLYSDAETSITLAGIERLNVTLAGYRATAGHYAEAGRIVGEIDPVWAREYRRQQASTLDGLGKVFGDKSALLEAVDIYRGVLREISKENEAEEWAKTQNNLGSVLQTLGEREDNPRTLQEAEAAYRAALEVRTRDKTPMDWAGTQNNLGIVLAVLGELEGNPHTLQESVAAFRAALEVRTHDKTPMAWAMTQNNLGGVLLRLGELEGNPQTLQESVAAFRVALEVRTRDKTPMDWAGTQNNLGDVLRVLGELESNPQTLQEAVDACRSALEVFFERSAPAYADSAKCSLAQAQAALDRLTPPSPAPSGHPLPQGERESKRRQPA